MTRPTDDDRHRQVLEAATTVIRERGFDSASISAIADAAGMGKSTVFHYFSSKDELVDRLQDRMFEIVRDELQAAADDATKRPEEQLRALLHIHATHCVERLSSPVLVAFIQRWGPPASKRGEQQIRARHRYEAVFEEAFVDCVASGAFVDRDARRATLGLIGMTTWIAMWYREGEDPPLDVVVDELLDMSFAGLLRRTS